MKLVSTPDNRFFAFGGLLGAALYLLQFWLAWPLTRWGGLKSEAPEFGDFYFLVSWSNTCANNANWGTLISWGNALSEVEGCETFNYGQALLLFLKLELIQSSNYAAVAIAFGVATSALVGAMIVGLSVNARRSRNRYLLATAVLVSPPASLLFERGNLDLVIFVLAVISAFALSNGYSQSAILILGLTSLIKLYTFPLLVILVVFLRKRSELALWSAVALFAVASVIRDFTRIEKVPGNGLVQFGWSVFDHYLQFAGIEAPVLSSTLGIALPVMVFSLCWFIPAFRRRVKALSRTLSQDSGVFAIWLSFSTIFVTGYLAGLSFDYRLIFLGVSGVVFLIHMDRGLLLWTSGTLLTCAMWGSALFPSALIQDRTTRILTVGPLQALGDLSVSVLVGLMSSVLLVSLLRKAKLSLEEFR